MRTQRGFALLELVLAAAVAMLIAVWASQALFNRLSDAGAQHSARWMLMVRAAVSAYIEQYGDSLRQAVAPGDLSVQGFQDWAAPALHELKAAGLLAKGFPEHERLVAGVRVQLMRKGVCPGDGCRIAAILHSQRALMKAPGVVDEQMLAQWLLSAQGLGGIVHPSRSQLIQGTTFQYPNPPDSRPALPPGTVAMAVSDEELFETPYLRVRDERDPRFQSDASVEGSITAGGVVTAGDYLQLGSTAQWFDACPSPGAVTRDVSGGLLLCTNGVWDIVSRSGGGYSSNSRHGCFTPDGLSSANPVTGGCSCPLGYRVVPLAEGGSADSTRGVTRGYLCVY